MAAQVDHPAAPRTLVAPPVIGQGRVLGQAAHHPPEAVAPVERPVDEHHGGGAGCGARPRRHMQGGRIGHGQGRRYLARPRNPIPAGRVGP